VSLVGFSLFLGHHAMFLSKDKDVASVWLSIWVIDDQIWETSDTDIDTLLHLVLVEELLVDEEEVKAKVCIALEISWLLSKSVGQEVSEELVSLELVLLADGDQFFLGVALVFHLLVLVEHV